MAHLTRSLPAFNGFSLSSGASFPLHGHVIAFEVRIGHRIWLESKIKRVRSSITLKKKIIIILKSRRDENCRTHTFAVHGGDIGFAEEIVFRPKRTASFITKAICWELPRQSRHVTIGGVSDCTLMIRQSAAADRQPKPSGDFFSPSTFHFSLSFFLSLFLSLSLSVPLPYPPPWLFFPGNFPYFYLLVLLLALCVGVLALD